MFPFVHLRRRLAVPVLAAWLLLPGLVPAQPGQTATTASNVPALPPQTVGGTLFPLATPATNAPADPTAKAAAAAEVAAMVAANTAVFNAMWSLEQQAGPTLVALTGTNAAAAHTAAQQWLAAWPEFEQSCFKACPEDPRLRENLQTARKHLQEGATLLAAGQLEAAREQSHALRTMMMQERARLGIDYLPDYLTRYGQPLEIALGKASRFSSTNTTRAELLMLRDYLVAVRGYWLQFLGAPRIDPARYRFTPAQLGELQAAVQANQVALKQLESAFEAGQPGPMLESLQGMVPPYVRLLGVMSGPPPGS
jgi:hypothetical protein